MFLVCQFTVKYSSQKCDDFANGLPNTSSSFRCSQCVATFSGGGRHTGNFVFKIFFIFFLCHLTYLIASLDTCCSSVVRLLRIDPMVSGSNLASAKISLRARRVASSL